MKKQLLLLAGFLIASLATFAQDVISTNGNFTSVGATNLSLRTNDASPATRLTIMNTTGFVGIATTSPSDMLHVVGNARADQFNAVSGVFNTMGSSNLSFNTNSTNRISVLNGNGYVGINKVSPAYQLDVNGTINATSFLLNGVEHRGSQWVTSGTAINYTSGFVGIGIATPSQLLQVHQAARAGMSATTSLTGSTITDGVHFGYDDANGAYVLNKENTPIIFSTNNTETLRISADGNVGIGTKLASNPNGYRLAVNGKIGARDVQVETSSATWPDYVFTKDYRLPSLAEVEKFVQENNHLENVPSAAEIEKNGHSLGDMDKILLKKVEELTLYVIQQQKEIEALKKKVEMKSTNDLK
jgi:hypothetical protein